MKEDQLQIAIVEWLRAVKPDCIWYHPVNSGRMRVQYRMKLLKMGLLPGVPDLAFAGMPSTPVAYVELKVKKGKQSPAQKDFEAECKDRDIPYFLVKTDEPLDAISQIEGFLKAWGAL